MDPNIRGLEKILEEHGDIETINIKIWDTLGLNEKTSFEGYIYEV